MTFQPPPPPPPPPAGPPPGSQPPGAWGPPPHAGGPPAGGGASRPAFNPATVNPLDWGILGAGVLAFIFSFFDYYTVSVSAGPYSASASASAWHGFFGWFAMLCALAGSVIVALELFMPQTKLPFPGRLVGLGLYAVATLCVILALFIFPGGNYDGPGVDEGHGIGYWVSLIVIIAGLVLSLMRFQQGGGKLPGALANMPNIGHYGPGQGPAAPGGPGVPPAGYAPPPAAPPAGPPPGYGPPPQP